MENQGIFSDCLFCCDQIKNRVIHEFNTVVAIADTSPVSDGHLLIIPKRHCSDCFQMTPEEWADSFHLIQTLKKKISSQDPTVTGYNIGANAGVSAGQTIFHCHIHLIPRRDGDTPDPRGGVRGVIPGKMNY